MLRSLRVQNFNTRKFSYKLPILDEKKPYPIYPFNFQMVTKLHLDELFINQWNDRPIYKSKLTFNFYSAVSRLNLDQKVVEVLKYILGSRIQKDGSVGFVCAIFPSENANENRCFQLWEEAIREAELTAKELAKPSEVMDSDETKPLCDVSSDQYSDLLPRGLYFYQKRIKPSKRR